MTYRTEQEDFWAGDFGTDYIARNEGRQLLASNLHFFSRALRVAGKIGSCIEFGANIGMNLRALKSLYPDMSLRGVEINATAAGILAEYLGRDNVFHESIFDIQVQTPSELALIKGVLIHINPDMLEATYRKLYESTNRWILICEYYNPSPVEVSYRGHSGRLYKRDFAGEIMEQCPGLALVDYGFSYRRDPAFPQDDITWFLLEKRI